MRAGITGDGTPRGDEAKARLPWPGRRIARACKLASALFAVGSALVAGPALAAGPTCKEWPGEMPLPSSAASSDAFAARWAQLRAAELSESAAAFAPTDPASAYRLYQHALCVDPQNARAKQGLADLAPRRDYLPAPIVVRTKPTIEQQRPRRRLAELDRTLDAVAAAVAQASFTTALDAASSARKQLEGMSATPDVLARRARLEVMASTAELALGQQAEATASLQRALQAQPDLVLDAQTPPKVRKLLESIRGGSQVSSQ